jgi:hypothetical protein
LNAIQSNSQIDNTYSQTRGSVFPYTQLASPNGSPLTIPFGYNQDYVQSAATNGFLDWSYSPLKQLGEPDDKTRNNDIRFTTGIGYTFIKGLNVEIKYQYEFSNLQNRDFESQDTYYTRNLINEYSIVANGQVTGYNIPLGGILNNSNTNVVSNNLRAQINYYHDWGTNNFTALAGYELSQTTSDFNTSTLYGYNDDNATFTNINPTAYVPINPSGNYSAINSGLNVGGTIARIRSSFINAAYTYNGKYIISASGRTDGSNYFGVATNDKTVPLWSAGGKWLLSDESFYKVLWLPKLSLRVSYGYNGNLDRSVTGVTTLQYFSNDFLTNLPYSTVSNIGNPDLRWEKTAITNFGIDFNTRNNVISGSLEYYFKKETDVLGYKNFPENSGITTLEGNYADMKGNGFDISITSRNIDKKFKWSTTLLVSHATDKITKYDVSPIVNNLVQSDGTGLSQPVIGKPVYGIFSYRWGGLDGANGNPVGYLNGVKSEDYTTINYNTPVNELVYSGSARPTYFGGLNNHFSYDKFALDIQINYKLGYYFRRPSLNYSFITVTNSSFLNVNLDFDKRWMKPGEQMSLLSYILSHMIAIISMSIRQLMSIKVIISGYRM